MPKIFKKGEFKKRNLTFRLCPKKHEEIIKKIGKQRGAISAYINMLIEKDLEGDK